MPMQMLEEKEKQKKLFHFMNKVKVMFLIDLPDRWVGLDEREYPPVEKGKIMLIDKETAKAFEENGWVEILE